MEATPIKAVFFDIGETIIDESRIWANWARRLGVPQHTFSAVFGATIARGEGPYDAFRTLRPDFDIITMMQQQGEEADFFLYDLYPDVKQCLAELKEQGLIIGLAGNQRSFAKAALEDMALGVDVIGTSHAWRVEKPSPEFFQRIATEAGFPVEQVLYVGDRLDNDILPAQQMGMHAVFVKRGPWAHLQASWPGIADVPNRIDNLTGIFRILDRINAPDSTVDPAP